MVPFAAGGTIANLRVARAAPNGHTILIHHMGMATAPALYKKLNFDPIKDFEYIGQVVDVPFAELKIYVQANRKKCRWPTWA